MAEKEYVNSVKPPKR